MKSVGLSLLAVFLVDGVFFLLARQSAHDRVTALSGILRNERSFLDPYRASETFTDLTNLGYLDCLVVSETQNKEESVFLDLRYRSECTAGLQWLTKRIPVETRMNTANGRDFTIQFLVRPDEVFSVALWISRFLAFSGVFSVMGWAWVRIDRERKLGEIRTQHMKELNEMASQVAHDIRSPIGALRVALEGVKKNAELSDETQLIERAVQRISSIAGDLLKKRRKTSSGRCEVVPVIEQIVKEKRVEYGRSPEVVIEYEVSELDQKTEVRIDSSTLGRILSNVINNAREALPESGGRIVVRLKSNRRDVEIQVEDSGRGMSPETLKKVRAGGVSIGKAEGSGLGLSYCLQQMERCGGRFELESRLGEGTRAVLMIPRG